MKRLQRFPYSTSFDQTRSKSLKHSICNIWATGDFQSCPLLLIRIWLEKSHLINHKNYIFRNGWNHLLLLSISATSNVQIWRGSFGILCYAKVILEVEWISTKWNHHILNLGPSECYKIYRKIYSKNDRKIQK